MMKSIPVWKQELSDGVHAARLASLYLFYTEVFYRILDITYRCINRVNWNYINIRAVLAIFISRHITTSLVNCNINLHSCLRI